MRRERKSKNMKSSSYLGSDKEIIQKKSANYKSRYDKSLSSEDKIVEKPYNPTYISRYK